jgi:dethiobiotin synthetase
LSRQTQSSGRQGLFVTGTDTGVGKTVVAVALLRAMAGRGLRAVGMKPVASGSVHTVAGLVNEDVVALTQASSIEAPPELVNPYCFQPAIAPHLAAAAAGAQISLARIVDAYHALAVGADCVVVEGAGGLMVPLNDRENFADLVSWLRLPVVLVVGMRLGCLNHALLTAEVLRQRGLTMAGWVANRIDADMAEFDSNLETLADRIDAPLIGTLPFLPENTAVMAQFLRLELLDAEANLRALLATR